MPSCTFREEERELSKKEGDSQQKQELSQQLEEKAHLHFDGRGVGSDGPEGGGERGPEERLGFAQWKRGVRGSEEGGCTYLIGCRRAQIREPMPVPAARVPLLWNCSGVYSAGSGRDALF
jgi:hypothetical protein